MEVVSPRPLPPGSEGQERGGRARAGAAGGGRARAGAAGAGRARAGAAGAGRVRGCSVERRRGSQIWDNS